MIPKTFVFDFPSEDSFFVKHMPYFQQLPVDYSVLKFYGLFRTVHRLI